MVQPDDREILVKNEQEWEKIKSKCWSCAKRKCRWLLYRGMNEGWLNCYSSSYKIWKRAYKFPIPDYEAPTQNDPYMYRVYLCNYYIKGRVIQSGRPRTRKRKR